MRLLSLGLSLGLSLVIACGDNRNPTNEAIDAPLEPDAPGSEADAQVEACPAIPASADVRVGSAGTTATHAQVFAGATWLTGPVAPAVSHDLTAWLLFTSTDASLPVPTVWCCTGSDTACCTLEGVIVETGALRSGAELGSHAVQIRGVQDATFELSGTLTITTFSHPFENAPGRIAGSVSASSGGRSVSGTFDNAFCPALLQSTL